MNIPTPSTTGNSCKAWWTFILRRNRPPLWEFEGVVIAPIFGRQDIIKARGPKTMNIHWMEFSWWTMVDFPLLIKTVQENRSFHIVLKHEIPWISTWWTWQNNYSFSRESNDFCFRVSRDPCLPHPFDQDNQSFIHCTTCFAADPMTRKESLDSFLMLLYEWSDQLQYPPSGFIPICRIQVMGQDEHRLMIFETGIRECQESIHF